MKVSKLEMLNTRKMSLNNNFKGNITVNLNKNLNEFSKSTNEAIKNLGIAQVKTPEMSSVLTFTGGKPNQVAHLISEGALSKGGGVATVINDWIKQWSNYVPENGKPTQHNFFIPYYNGDVIKDENGVKVLPVKENGKTFYVSDVDDLTQVTASKGKKIEIKELLESTIKENEAATGRAKNITYHI